MPSLDGIHPIDELSFLFHQLLHPPSIRGSGTTNIQLPDSKFASDTLIVRHILCQNTGFQSHRIEPINTHVIELARWHFCSSCDGPTFPNEQSAIFHPQ